MSAVEITRAPAGRKPHEIRPLTIETGVNAYAEGSCIIRAGNTHVLCTASVEESVPPWLNAQNKAKGETQGWITAEYSMLPRATHTRTKRDREKISGRTQEIQRLIGRALRAMVDLKALGPRSILVDCDVLQADGGTRTASISGACVAVALALRNLEARGLVKMADVMVDTVAAVSVGIKDGRVLADLDYNEDSACDVDMNFVVTGKGGFVEVQGTAERKAFSKAELDAMTASALAAIEQIRTIQKRGFTTFG